MTVIVSLFLLVGSLFIFTATLGLVRFPNFYTRIHACSLASGIGVICTMVATMIFFYVDGEIFAGRAMLALVFVFVTTPVGMHMIGKSFFYNERNVQDYKTGMPEHSWLDQQYYVVTMSCEPWMSVLQQPLSELFFTSQMGVKIIKIIREEEHINIPEATETLRPGDCGYFAGTRNQLIAFRDLMRLEAPSVDIGRTLVSPRMTLREFAQIQKQLPIEDQLLCYAVVLEKGMPLIGQKIKDTAIKSEWGGLLIGLERELYPLFNPDANLSLEKNDLIWILGSHDTAEKMAEANMM